jgi:hypothetical protein
VDIGAALAVGIAPPSTNSLFSTRASLTSRFTAHGWHAWVLVISVDPEVHGAVNEVAMKRALAIRIAWTEDEGIQEMRNGRFKAIFLDVTSRGDSNGSHAKRILSEWHLTKPAALVVIVSDGAFQRLSGDTTWAVYSGRAEPQPVFEDGALYIPHTIGVPQLALAFDMVLGVWERAATLDEHAKARVEPVSLDTNEEVESAISGARLSRRTSRASGFGAAACTFTYLSTDNVAVGIVLICY